MKILVYEWISAGGLIGRRVPESLRRDGESMAAALLDDLTAVAGAEVETVRGEDAWGLDLPVRVWPARSRAESLARYRALVRECDAVWPVAPETDGVLADLIGIAASAGARVVGCSEAAVRLCTSKHATSAALRAAGIACVPTYRHGDALPDARGAWVVKPDDGAGCEDTLRVARVADARRLLAAPPRRVAQPWIEGEPMSLSVLYGNGMSRVLACNRQRIDVERERVSLAGVEIAVDNPRRDPFEALARQIGEAIPGLSGFVGIDLVDAEDGPCAIEINPRLTLSYRGLSRALGANVAAATLAADPGGSRPAVVPSAG